MAHNIDESNGRNNMAYRGEKPWHGLGFQIEEGDSPEVIAQKAGLVFEIKKGKLLMQTEEGEIIDASDLNRSVLYRDDTKARLSVMSTDKYKVVQPAEIVDFIASSAAAMGWSIETAGSLKGGRKIWALANTGEQADVGKGDTIKGYLLAATACDGSMASEFLFTSVRVVCDNTLHMAVDGHGGGLKDDGNASRVKVFHFNELDVNAVKKQLGIAETIWARFIQQAKDLSKIKLDDKKAVQILRSVYTKQSEKEVDGQVISDEQFLKENMTAGKILGLYQGSGIGMELPSSHNTAWGLVNAATEYFDHASKTWSVDNRLNSAWFGPGATKKQQVVDACFEIAG